MMKAIVQRKYGMPGDVLELAEVDKPLVGDDEVQVRVRAASANPADWHRTTGTPYLARLDAGLLRPKHKVAGADIAGEVEAVGNNVTRFQPGDEVFGETSGGAFAEYQCVSPDVLVTKPANVSFEEAAAVPIAALTALQGLRDRGRIQPGHRVLINGASGGVGTFAVQIAKSFGAEVTGVCSARNVDMVRSIGADHVIDYSQENFTRGEERYDLILDTVGNHRLSACRRVLSPKGTFVVVGGPKTRKWLGPLPRLLRALAVSPFVSQRMVGMLAKPNQHDMLVLQELLETEQVKPVIDRRYTLGEVPQALEYLGDGHVAGKLVFSI